MLRITCYKEVQPRMGHKWLLDFSVVGNLGFGLVSFLSNADMTGHAAIHARHRSKVEILVLPVNHHLLNLDGGIDEVNQREITKNIRHVRTDTLLFSSKTIELG